MKFFIDWMYENNSFIKDGIIYVIKYVYSKKYRCVNGMWILSILSFIYMVILDICINDLGHNIIKIDVINGSDETYLIKNLHERYRRI